MNKQYFTRMTAIAALVTALILGFTACPNPTGGGGGGKAPVSIAITPPPGFTGYTLSQPDMTSAGTKTVTVTYTFLSTAAFTVQPKSNLSMGTYTATVMVSGGNGISAAFNGGRYKT